MNVFDLAQQDTQLKKVSHKEYAGPCPGCHGTDRFHVQPTRRDGGAWMCRNCWPAEEKGWGDNVAYLMTFKGMKYPKAKEYLSGETETALERVKRVQQYATLDYGQIPNQQWQERAMRYAAAAQERLRTAEGQAALDYLRSRGLTDETIKKAHLGYAKYHGVPCVVIPWFDEREQAYWRINLRDIRPDSERSEDEKRYRNITGSSNAGLYLGDSLNFKRPTFLVEGEIDALSIAQEAGNLVNVVATGTVTGSYTVKWIGRLARVPHVLVAYDRDHEGDQYAKERWLKVLENATRWRPLAHDVNAMLVEVYDVRSWVTAALDYLSEMVPPAQVEQVSPALLTQEPVDQVQAASAFRCSECSIDLTDVDQDAYIDHEDGLAYCKAHWHARNTLPVFTSQEQFLETVGKLAMELDGVTGTHWTVTALQPGIPRKVSLEQHVAMLSESRRRTEPTVAEQAIMHRLRAYGVFLGDYCTCGSRLKWNSAGTVVCARCEPGGLWSNQAIQLLKSA